MERTLEIEYSTVIFHNGIVESYCILHKCCVRTVVQPIADTVAQNLEITSENLSTDQNSAHAIAISTM